MEGLRIYLQTVREKGYMQERLPAVLYIAIAGRVTAGPTLLSAGSTWREVSEILKKLRIDKAWVTQLEVDPKALPARDRAKYWYTAIAQYSWGTQAMHTAALALGEELKAAGLVIQLPQRTSKQA
jgi:hypothetical protein